MHFVIIQRHAFIHAQRNDRAGNIAVAGQGATNRGLISALQRHGDSPRILNLGQVVHVRVRVGLRLRGPRLLPGQRIARRQGVLLCPGQLRAVALVFQNFGLAPLVQRVRAIRQPIVTDARGVPVIARAIRAIVPARATP